MPSRTADPSARNRERTAWLLRRHSCAAMNENAAALRHGETRPRNRVGEIEIRNRGRERKRRIQRTLNADSFPDRRIRGRRFWKFSRFCELRRVGSDRNAQCLAIVVRQSLVQHFGKRTQDGPVLLCLAWWKGRAARALHAAFEIRVKSILFRVGGARKYDIGPMGAEVAMRPLIDDEGAPQITHVEFVGTEQIDEIDLV